MKLNSLEIKDKRANLVKRCNEIISTCKKEIRELTEAEEKEIEDAKAEIKVLNEQLRDLQAKLDQYEEVREDYGTEEEEKRGADEEEKPQDNQEEQPVENKEEEPVEEPAQEEEEGAEEENEEDRECGEEEKEENNKEEKRNKETMKTKKFSLVKEIRNAMKTNQEINLGEINRRAAGSGYTVTEDGVDFVQTDVFDIVEPLRAKNVLIQAGAKFLGGLTNNAQIPLMNAVTVKWESEVGAAEDGSGDLSNKKLTPHRLTAYCPISLQAILQDSVGLEQAIRNDLVEAINSKLEATILSSGNTEGLDCIFSGATSAVTISDFGDVVDLEATVEGNNADVTKAKYILAPTAKADLRGMIKGTNGTGMVFENGEIDGTAAFSTSHVEAGRVAYGDFSNVVIGQWGDTILSVEPDAKNGKINIIVNAFFDCKILHQDEVIATGKTR